MELKEQELVADCVKQLGREFYSTFTTNFRSIQVSGDAPTLPWVRSIVWVGAGLGLALREGWVDRSPITWIYCKFLG